MLWKNAKTKSNVEMFMGKHKNQQICINISTKA